MPNMMRAAVIYQAGGPDALQLEDRPIPEPQNGHVLIKVYAFGLNRSELFTRQGLSPGGRSTFTSLPAPFPFSKTVLQAHFVALFEALASHAFIRDFSLRGWPYTATTLVQ